MQEPQELQVQLLGREDPLEQEMAVHSPEEPGGLQSVGSQSKTLLSTQAKHSAAFWFVLFSVLEGELVSRFWESLTIVTAWVGMVVSCLQYPCFQGHRSRELAWGWKENECT